MAQFIEVKLNINSYQGETKKINLEQIRFYKTTTLRCEWQCCADLFSGISINEKQLK